jgi:peptidoglycan/LPS O-acetylase OafA/YrhL
MVVASDDQKMVTDVAAAMGDRRPHLPALDGLRGMAAYMVVVSHVSNVTGLWGNLLGNGGGQVGVMIFFVLSGYLIGALYLDQPFTLANVWDYAARRAGRVLPAFYAVLTLVLVLHGLSAATGWNLHVYPITWEQSVSHYALLWGVGVFWTIPVEMHFYVVFVAAWWVYSRSRVAMVVAAVVAIRPLLERACPGAGRGTHFTLLSGFFPDRLVDQPCHRPARSARIRPSVCPAHRGFHSSVPALSEHLRRALWP